MAITGSARSLAALEMPQLAICHADEPPGLAGALTGGIAGQ
jgi:hypothetical protein